MCQAFSCIVTRKDVFWKLGMDSHEDIIRKHGLADDQKAPDKLTFGRVEIAPKNGNYLEPDEWIFKIDQSITPMWWRPLHEKRTWAAHKKWLAELDKILVRKPIVHPLKINAGKVGPEEIALLKEWASVRASVEASVRASVWDSVRTSVGDSVWASVWDSVEASVGASVRTSVGASVRASVEASVRTSVGDSVWDSVRASVWDSVRDSVRASVGDSVEASVRASVWDSVGDSVWASVGDSVEVSVGDSVWASVWAYIGSFFDLPRKAWLYTKNIKTKDYPFEPAVKLWERGFIPSFDGKTWRLHAGPKAKIVYELSRIEGE